MKSLVAGSVLVRVVSAMSTVVSPLREMVIGMDRVTDWSAFSIW